MIPKEFERSNLALELKVGKKRLELVLHGLTNEQCGMAGAVRSGSVTELVSHLIKNAFLALIRRRHKSLIGIPCCTLLFWCVSVTTRNSLHRWGVLQIPRHLTASSAKLSRSPVRGNVVLSAVAPSDQFFTTCGGVRYAQRSTNCRCAMRHMTIPENSYLVPLAASVPVQ